MKYLIAFVVVMNGTLAFADSKALEKCVAAYALTAVEEYNLPNEVVISESQAAKDSSYDVISRMLIPKYGEQALRAFAGAQAVGLIIQYADEVELIYVGVKIENGQCQIHLGASLNTADMTGEDTLLKPDEASKFFLNYSKQEMEQMLGEDSTIGDIYDVVEETLSY
ncbi:hypothetical protein D3C87_1188400 [compost metagenome]